MKKNILITQIFLVFMISGYTQSWEVTGNAGTNPNVNFVGTTDAHQLVLRVNNNRAGYIEYDSTKGAASFGYRALFSGPGVANTAVGYQALFSNTSGNSNTAMGYLALYSNTIGIHNIAIGQRALYANVGGHSNVAIGYQALTKNNTGITSTAVGHAALAYNTAGHSNVAIGFNAQNSNTTGNSNTAVGNNTLFSNTTGKFNTAVGWSAGSVSDKNNYCTFLGYDADQAGAADYNNSMALGNKASITANNQVRIGNSSVISIGGYVGWTDLPSDARFKKNIKENVPGLQFINQLRPVTYNVDLIKLNQFLNTENRDETSALENNASLEKISETDEAWTKTGIDEKEKVVRTGFVAQEVEVAAKKLGYDFSGVDKPQNKYSLYGLRYAEFVVPLVKAVQELSKMNDDKEAKINAQQKINENLQKQINELKAMINANIKVQPDLASIEQNKPNPFSNSSSINYFIPAGAKNARLNITDNAGKIIKQITLNAKTGIVNINAPALSNGTYYYTLLVDGKLIETKKMIVTH